MHVPPQTKVLAALKCPASIAVLPPMMFGCLSILVLESTPNEVLRKLDKRQDGGTNEMQDQSVSAIETGRKMPALAFNAETFISQLICLWQWMQTAMTIRSPKLAGRTGSNALQGGGRSWNESKQRMHK